MDKRSKVTFLSKDTQLVHPIFNEANFQVESVLDQKKFK